MSDFANILISMEDRGGRAVVDALKELGVIQHDHDRLTFRFLPVEVAQEVLEKTVEKHLGRR